MVGCWRRRGDDDRRRLVHRRHIRSDQSENDDGRPIENAGLDLRGVHRGVHDRLRNRRDMGVRTSERVAGLFAKPPSTGPHGSDDARGS